MKMRCAGIAVALAACMLAGPVGAGDLKIGVVDLNELIRQHPDTSPSEKLLEQQAKDMDAEKKEMLDKYEQLKKEFEEVREATENSALNEEGKAQKQKLAEEKFIEIKKFERDLKQTLGQRQDELRDRGKRMRDRIVEELKVIVNDYAKDNKFDLVVNSGESALMGLETVLYRSDALDITAEVTKIVKEKAAKKE